MQRISAKERKILERLLALTYSGKLEWRPQASGFRTDNKFFCAEFYYNFLTIVYAPGVGSQLVYDTRQAELANGILQCLQRQQRKWKARRMNHECDLVLAKIEQFEQQQRHREDHAD